MISIMGNIVQTISTECLLLFLCSHGAKHCWSELKLICDLSGLIVSNNLDWDWIMGNRNKVGTENVICGIVFMPPRARDRTLRECFNKRHKKSVYTNKSIQIEERFLLINKCNFTTVFEEKIFSFGCLFLLMTSLNAFL